MSVRVRGLSGIVNRDMDYLPHQILFSDPEILFSDPGLRSYSSHVYRSRTSLFPKTSVICGEEIMTFPMSVGLTGCIANSRNRIGGELSIEMGARILIVEDEAGLITALKDRLRKEGYKVSVAEDGIAGHDLATNEQFDLIVLDLKLPGQSGLTVCQKLRQQGSLTPILMLTARRQTADKVVGLQTGADDYLTKPFQMAELLARINALLRRAARPAPPSGTEFQFGKLKLDIKRTEVTRDGQIVKLSSKEFHLLRYLIVHRGETISREALLHEVWGYDELSSTRTVDVHVLWLREKIEEDPRNPQMILTVVGLGYKFAG